MQTHIVHTDDSRNQTEIQQDCFWSRIYPKERPKQLSRAFLWTLLTNTSSKNSPPWHRISDKTDKSVNDQPKHWLLLWPNVLYVDIGPSPLLYVGFFPSLLLQSWKNLIGWNIFAVTKLFQHLSAPVYKLSTKTWFAKVFLEDLESPAQNPDLNPIEHFCDEVKRWIPTITVNNLHESFSQTCGDCYRSKGRTTYIHDHDLGMGCSVVRCPHTFKKFFFKIIHLFPLLVDVVGRADEFCGWFRWCGHVNVSRGHIAARLG